MSADASTTDANRVPTVDDSQIQWKDATSANGVKYQTGILKPEHSGVDEGEEKDLLRPTKLQKKAVGSLGGQTTLELVTHTLPDLWWPVTNDDSWKTPAKVIKDSVDIKQYCLTKNVGGWYDYKLWIDITQDWDYTFYDETGDYYDLDTYQKGVHYVRYDSKKPTIVKIVAKS